MGSLFLLVLAASLAPQPPAAKGAADFTLVNGTDSALSKVAIRRFASGSWKDIPNAPAPGAKAPVPFRDEECAFDIRADLGGKTAVWSAVNLCGAKAVTLKRNASGELWVDYED